MAFSIFGFFGVGYSLVIGLLDDATHLMAPTGEDANFGMCDGAELGRLIACRISGAPRLRKSLSVRSASAAVEAERILKLRLGNSAP